MLLAIGWMQKNLHSVEMKNAIFKYFFINLFADNVISSEYEMDQNK